MDYWGGGGGAKGMLPPPSQIIVGGLLSINIINPNTMKNSVFRKLKTRNLANVFLNL